MDVIDFIMYKENCTKAEAINKAKEIISPLTPKGGTKTPLKNILPMERENFLANMYQYFKNAVHNSKPAKEYLESRSLDFKRLEVGYNAGQFHHGARKDENVIAQCLEYGLLIDKKYFGQNWRKSL
jgi:hypothetical protein